jgi:DNA-binding NarL/FixJ family response regulator
MEALVHHVQSSHADGYIQKSSDTGYLLERIRAALA